MYTDVVLNLLLCRRIGSGSVPVVVVGVAVATDPPVFSVVADGVRGVAVSCLIGARTMRRNVA